MHLSRVRTTQSTPLSVQLLSSCRAMSQARKLSAQLAWHACRYVLAICTLRNLYDCDAYFTAWSYVGLACGWHVVDGWFLCDWQEDQRELDALQTSDSSLNYISAISVKGRSLPGFGCKILRGTCARAYFKTRCFPYLVGATPAIGSNNLSLNDVGQIGEVYALEKKQLSGCPSVKGFLILSTATMRMSYDPQLKISKRVMCIYILECVRRRGYASLLMHMAQAIQPPGSSLYIPQSTRMQLSAALFFASMDFSVPRNALHLKSWHVNDLSHVRFQMEWALRLGLVVKRKRTSSCVLEPLSKAAKTHKVDDTSMPKMASPIYKSKLIKTIIDRVPSLTEEFRRQHQYNVGVLQGLSLHYEERDNQTLHETFLHVAERLHARGHTLEVKRVLPLCEATYVPPSVSDKSERDAAMRLFTGYAH